MAKTVKITFYNPKELWRMFCNWVFWPRRKKCVEWCDYYDGVLRSKIVDILQSEIDSGSISDAVAKRLELNLKIASEEVANATAEMMSKPFE